MMGKNLIKFIESVIFSSKWLLIPFYLVLILSLGVYTYFDIFEFIDYIEKLGTINKDGAMLTVIELIDLTMIANLTKMIITGSYNSFVSKDHGRPNEHISSGTLKVKMGTSLVGITSIGLLQRSVTINTSSWEVLFKLAFVHGIFLISSLVLMIVVFLHEKTELEERKFEHSIEKEHEHEKVH